MRILALSACAASLVLSACATSVCPTGSCPARQVQSVPAGPVLGTPIAAVAFEGSLPGARGQEYDSWYRVGGTTICTNDSYMFPQSSGDLGRVRMVGMGLGPQSWDNGYPMSPVGSGWRCRDMRTEIFNNGRDASRGYKHIAPGDAKCFTERADSYPRPDGGARGWSLQGGEHGKWEAPGIHLVGVPAKASSGTFQQYLELHDAGLNVGFTFDGTSLQPWRQTQPGFQC